MMDILSAGIAAAALATTAAAPGGNTLGGAMLDKISISDVSTMMGEFGMTSEVLSLPTGGKALMVTTEGGAKFAFSFLGCDDQANGNGCANTVVTTGYPGAGVSLETINAFNGAAVVTTGIKVSEQNIVIFGRNIVVLGGHARELFKGTVYLFLKDVQNFADANQGSANTISMRGGEAPRVFLGAGEKDYSLETATAIANTKDVTFALSGPAPY